MTRNPFAVNPSDRSHLVLRLLIARHMARQIYGNAKPRTVGLLLADSSNELTRAYGRYLIKGAAQ